MKSASAKLKSPFNNRKPIATAITATLIVEATSKTNADKKATRKTFKVFIRKIFVMLSIRLIVSLVLLKSFKVGKP